MAGRKRHSAEEIVRKLRRADELTAAGKTGEEIAAELGVSAATLYNWRRQYGGVDTDAAKGAQGAAGAERQVEAAADGRGAGEGRVAGDREGKILSPAAKRRATDMLREVRGLSERFACKVVGLSRSTYRRQPATQTPADPDAGLRAWLRSYATKHQGHGFRRAWAALRFDEGSGVNKKKVHRLWREEGLQVRAHSPRKCAGCSSVPTIEADAPKVVWALDFQFDSTTDGRAVKIASMIDEHTRESLLHVVERSITAEKLVAELEKVFTARGGPPRVLRMDNGPEMISRALQQFCADRVGIVYIPPGTPWNNGFVESFNRRLRAECLNRNHWTSLLEARVVIGDFKDEHSRRHRHSALGYLTPAEYAARCGHTHHPMACSIN
ncbi:MULTISPECIES: IS3 family transposase [unclassified Nocardia]|uniref:IS3 family transposase n=1 Tax=unclassified Nocardia TaxID=2637762 RepID=UPI001CE3D78A|nr:MULTISPECIES: IS3 family transposase [unclassified Nocardia]